MVARKIAIIQRQMNVERSFERIRRLVGKETLLLPREKTMRHFSQIFLDHAEKFQTLRSKLLVRSLWLKLITARALGPEGEALIATETDLDPDDLVALAIRQDSLKKTEQYLADSLVKLRVRRKELMTRYEHLGVFESNQLASRTMASRLGLDAEDAVKSPAVKALGAYVKRAAAQVVSTVSAAPIAEAERQIGRAHV